MLSDPIVSPEALRAAREKAGLTQHELARLVGVAGGERVSRWERGSSAPRPDVLHRVAAVLGIGPRDLLTPLVGSPDVRRLRTLAGLSLEALAARAHTSVSTVNRWEAGRIERIPDRVTLDPVAAALRVTIENVELALAEAKRADRARRT
jgi:transcriptional regulator with XRE-family HTH domain